MSVVSDHVDAEDAHPPRCVGCGDPIFGSNLATIPQGALCKPCGDVVDRLGYTPRLHLTRPATRGVTR